MDREQEIKRRREEIKRLESIITDYDSNPIVEESLVNKMDESRTVNFEHVSIQFAHPKLVFGNALYQKRIYLEHLISPQQQDRPNVMRRVYHQLKKIILRRYV